MGNWVTMYLYDQGGKGGQSLHRTTEQSQKSGGERQEGPGARDLGQRKDDGEREPGARRSPYRMSQSS